MTGIDKILQKIEDDCEKSCGQILSKAKAQQVKILDDAKAESEKIKQNVLQSTKEKGKKDIELSKSKAENLSKQQLLEAKIKLINDIINEGLDKLKSLPDDEYFKVLDQLIVKSTCMGNGVVQFSKRDLDRIPKDFELTINNKLSDDKSVSISSDAVEIDGGFIIAYGNVLQNCSFDALLNDKINKIKDQLFDIVFMRDII